MRKIHFAPFWLSAALALALTACSQGAQKSTRMLHLIKGRDGWQIAP
ncbi:MAG: hypothetical protein ACYCY3_11165 [Halothiobacillus sp.]